MDALQKSRIEEYVNINIDSFHTNRLSKITNIKLHDILRRKNPYLFRAKGIVSGFDLSTAILEAFLSSSEEEQFGKFLEGLAIFVAELTTGGIKSPTQGIDLDFTRENVRYLVAIKSGPNWGNSSQYGQLKSDFQTAKRVLHQSKSMHHVQPVLGCCYGRIKTVDAGLYIKITGQAFWEFLSGDKELYIEIVEPIGTDAKRHNDDYLSQKALVIQRFALEIIELFCLPSGEIDWARLLKFNSGNVKD